MDDYRFEIQYDVPKQMQKFVSSRFYQGDWVYNFIELTDESIANLDVDDVLHLVRVHFTQTLYPNLPWLYNTLLKLDKMFGKAKESYSFETFKPFGLNALSHFEIDYELSDNSQSLYDIARDAAKKGGGVTYNYLKPSTPVFHKGGVISPSKYTPLNIETIYIGKSHKPVYWEAEKSEGTELARMAKQLPGVMENVKYPCVCYNDKGSIYNIIIHLNDSCGWSRDKIADWLETLDVDLTFKLPEEKEKV